MRFECPADIVNCYRLTPKDDPIHKNICTCDWVTTKQGYNLGPYQLAHIIPLNDDCSNGFLLGSVQNYKSQP